MKWMLMLVTVFAMAIPAMAFEPNDMEFTFAFGDEILSNHVGIKPFPADHFSFGLVLTGIVSEERLDTSVKINDWLVGVYIEYPFLNVTEIPPFPVPINAELFAGAEIQKFIGANSDWYWTPYIGAEIAVSKNVIPRIEGRYNRRDDIMPEWVLSAGITVRFK